MDTLWLDIHSFKLRFLRVPSLEVLPSLFRRVWAGDDPCKAEPVFYHGAAAVIVRFWVGL